MTATATADALFAAHGDGSRVPAPSATIPGLDLDAAYAIQRELVARHVAAGQRPIGWKVGMAAAVGRTPDSPGPIYGRLLSGMVVEPGGELAVAALHEPYVEGEIALVLGRPLRGPGVTRDAALAAVGEVRPAIEVYARRIEAAASEPADMVADNALCAHVVIGSGATPPDALDLRLTGLVLSRGEEIVGVGAGAQVLGHPAAALAWLADALAAHGQQLEEGDVVLTGALAGAHPPRPGDVFTAEADRLGSVSVRFT